MSGTSVSAGTGVPLGAGVPVAAGVPLGAGVPLSTEVLLGAAIPLSTGVRLTTGVPLIGRVASYDAGRGLGTVAEGDGGVAHAHLVHTFHCTAIADGSRAIEVGTPVAFVLVAGLSGVLEARAVTRIVADGGD